MNTYPILKRVNSCLCLAVFLLVLLLIAPPALAATGINKQINFQGKVVNANGTNIANGNYDFVFSIYTVATAGTAIWIETRTTVNQVAVTDGIFRVSLGSITALPGSIDFNTDNIYLGINFNSDGEMTPRVQFTAVPQAFNALKVAGLTVTDTTGTFTLAAAKTLTVNNTLTFAGTDATTVTFQGTDTYVGRATTDTLTNKTIGTTGLTFSGATTDITTAAGEALVITPSGAAALTLGTTGVGNTTSITFATDGTGDAEIVLPTGSISTGEILDATIAPGDLNTQGVETDEFCLTRETTAGAPLEWQSCGGAASAWSGLTAPTADLALNHAEFITAFTFDAPTTAAAKDYFTLASLNDATTDSTTQRLLVLNNNDDALSTGATESLLVIDNKDANEAVTNAILIANSGGGAFTNYINAPNFSITNAGLITTSSNLAVNGGTISSTGTLTLDATSTTIIPDADTFQTDDVTSTGVLSLVSAAASNIALNPGTTGDIVLTHGNGSQLAINATPTGDTAQDSAKLTLNSTITGSTATLQGFVISQSDNANTGVYDSLFKLENLKTPETTTNGLFIEHNAASGTLSNAVHITNTAGTLTSAIVIDGTAPGSFILDSGSIDISGAGAITGATGITSATGNVAITAGDLTLNSVTRISNAGVGTFITGSVLGSQTFTTNNIADSGALTIKSGGTSALTLDTSGAAALNLGNTNATSLVLGNVTTNPTLTLTGSGLTTLGGGLTFSGTTARTVTGPATGGLTVNTTSGPLTLSTTTTGTLAVTSAGALNFTGVAASTWLTSGASSTLIIEAGATTANTALTLRSANQSTGTTNSGGLTILSGNAAGATSTAGNIVLDVGTSTTSNGSILIGTAARAQTITIGNSTGGTITVGQSSGSDLVLNDAQWSVTGVGAATFASVTAPTHTGAAAVTVSSGGTSGLTFDSASGDITVAANDGLTFAATTLGNNGSRNVTINSGTGGTTATLIVKLDTSGTVVTTDTTTLNNAVGVALNTTTAGGAVRVAINGVVTATADNAVTAGDYIGVGTAIAGRAKSLGTTYPSTAGVQVIGRALGTQATPGSTFLLMLNGLDNNVAAGGGGGTLQTAYDTASGNTILTTTARNIAFTLGEVATPTSLTLENQDTAGVSAQRIFNSIASGTLTNGLLIEQTGAGILTNAIQIAGTAGTITSGILIADGAGAITTGLTMTGTFTNLIDTPNFDVSNAGNLDTGGTITAGSGNVALTNAAGNIIHDALTDCAEGQILKWTAAGGWACAADATGGGGTTTTITKSANQAATQSSTTMQNVTELVFAMAASKTYIIEAYIPVDTSNATADLKYTVTVPTGATLNLFNNTYSTATAVITCNIVASAQVCATTVNSAVNQIHMRGFVANGVNAGNFQIQFAQNTAAAASFPVIKKGSTLFYTPTAGADLAETYFTNDTSIAPGDVVSIDLGLQTGVKKSTSSYDRNLLGIISTNPGLLLGEGGGSGMPVPVALSGRVPVKVSAENGTIKVGDLLTSSSLPGVAMRATKAGPVLGQALTPFEGEGVGEVIVFIKNSYFYGSGIASLLPGLTQENISTVDKGRAVLAEFLKQTDEATVVSEILTDRLVAAKEVISPLIITDTLFAKTIKADKIEGLEILTNKISSLQGQAAGLSTSSTQTIDGGNVEDGSLKIDNGGSNEASPSSIFDPQSSTINFQSSTVNVLNLNANGGLVVLGPSEFKGESLFDKLATFISHVIFKDDVTFLGRPTFNKDTAGFAVIEKGADLVEVVFEKEYETTPIVSTSFAFDEFKKEDGIVDDQSIRRAKLFEQGYSFMVVNRTKKGFTIVLNKKASENLTFSWVAFAVKDAKTAVSPEISAISNTAVEPTPSLSPTPSPQPEATSSASVN